MRRGWQQLAAFVAFVCAATPVAAFESFNQPERGVKFYFSVPLDGATKKERTTSAGFAIQGKREYESIRVDSGLINNFLGGGIEAKWVIAGVIATGAVVAVASKDKSRTASQQQQQQQQAQQQAAQSGGGSSATGSFHPDGTPHVDGDNCACHQ